MTGRWTTAGSAVKGITPTCWAVLQWVASADWSAARYGTARRLSPKWQWLE